MAQLHDVMAYLLQNYPANMAHELSNARLTKMVYLADWHQALTHGRQMTDIQWYFDNFGPFVRDVEQRAADMDELFVVDLGSNMYGQAKKTFSVRDRSYTPRLTDDERKSCDHIIEVTRKLYWAPFIKLVYSTHPIASSERHTFLDLILKAAEYRQQQLAAAG
ncbi:Panacea domain-containing protein [Mesorhizobium sp. M0184]|uniref:Panacea domain-containing protein n=1 Tax=Mesorhizobium sp. M0184 TaxID=2956906 RepID=UPI00333D2BBC